MFGEYDTKYREFDFNLGNGTRIQYTAYGREISLVLTNGGRAQNWTLEPSEAEDVLRRTSGDRHVVLLLKLEVTGTAPAVGAGALLINTRIVEYEIRGHGNVRLGNVVVK